MTLIIVLWIVAATAWMAHTVPLVETYPRQKWYFDVLDWLLWPIMKKLFNGKLTHAWHWSTYSKTIRIKGDVGYAWPDELKLRAFRGDPRAPIVRGSWSQIKAEYSGWRKAVVIRAASQASDYRFSDGWRIGFIDPATRTQKVCTVLLRTPMASCYLGHDDVVFFALAKSGEQLIFDTKLTDRDAPDVKRYPLL